MSGFDYRRFYDRFAPLYASAMRLIPVWRRYTEEALPWLPEQGRVLEIGHGPGLLLEQIARHNESVLGLDLSLGMIRQTARRLRGAGLSAMLVNGDAAHLPFADGSLAAIVMTFAFSAVPDGAGAMHEFARALRPGGRLVLVDAGIPTSGNRVGAALGRLWTLFGDFMRDESALMRGAGLDVIECREFGAFDSIRLVVGLKPER